MAKQATLLFRGETLYEDGRAVGFRLEDEHDLLGTGVWGEPRVPVTRTCRRSGANLATEVAARDGAAPMSRYASPYEPVTAMLALAFARSGMPAHADRAFDRDLRTSCRRAVAARFPEIDADGFHARARADLGAARDACDPFFRTLDPDALRHGVRKAFPPLTGDTYGSLDRTFDAPLLGQATTWFPHLGGTMRSLMDPAREDRAAFLQAIPQGRAATRAALVAALEGQAMMASGRDPGAGEAEVRVAEALGALPDDIVARIAERLEASPGAGAEDPARTLSGWLHRLPAHWWPSTQRQWELVAECSLAAGLGSNGAYAPPASFLRHHPDLAAYLGTDGDWQALAHACQDAVSERAGMRERDFPDAFEDLAATFGRLVVGPAVAASNIPAQTARSAPDEARASSLLRSGLGFADEAGLARLWLARRGDVDRGVAALALEGPRSAWPAGLPGKRRGAYGVTVLGSVRELLDEGMWGVDDDGVPGLDHAMGLRLGPVLSGRERVVSVRRMEGGTTTRLATARLGIGRKAPWLIEVTGRSGKRPPAEAVKLLDSYVASLASDPSCIPSYVDAVWGGTPPRPRTTSVPGDPLPVDPVLAHGYDPSVPGAWEAVLAMFDEMLPPDLRDVAREGLAAMALAVDARMPGLDQPAGDYEVFSFGDDVDPADVEAMLARMVEAPAPKP